jgi:Ribonuclease G/E
MNQISEIKEFYSNGIWEERFSNTFDQLKRSQDENFYNFVLKVISENRNEKYVEEAMRSLKFYKLNSKTQEEKKPVISAIQAIVLSKTSSLAMKERAIIELGNLGDWPDKALREIIVSDEDRYLKIYAFRAILTQLKLPYQVIDLETDLAKDGEIEPSFARIELITQARADGHFDHLKSE